MTKVSTWRKSSFSAQQTDCVEVAGTLMEVRDTKRPGVAIAADVRALVRMIQDGGLTQG